MRSNLIAYCVAAGTVCLSTVTNSLADGGAFRRGCAARDMQIMMMIEGSEISQIEMNDAVHAMIDARMMCFEGYVMDALARYDRIAQGLTK